MAKRLGRKEEPYKRRRKGKMEDYENNRGTKRNGRERK